MNLDIVDMVRKSLSVGPDTWKALSSLGKFGMSFDDIIKILLLEHNELMRIKGQKEIPLGPAIYNLSPEAQDQTQLAMEYATQQQQQQQEKDPLYLMEAMELTVNLPGLKFPANKAKILEYAEKANSEHIFRYHVLPIPNKTYKNKTELKDELLNNAISIGPVIKTLIDAKFFGYKIDDRELRKEQYQSRISQQQEELNKFNQMQKVKGVIKST